MRVDRRVVTSAERDTYRCDGVVRLRAVLDPARAMDLAKAWDEALAAAPAALRPDAHRKAFSGSPLIQHVSLALPALPTPWHHDSAGRPLSGERIVGACPRCPDFEQRRNDPDLRFLSREMDPGDALFIHPRTLHFSPGYRTASRRLAYATWWYGDDVVWDPRPECEAPPPGVDPLSVHPGERPAGASIPIVWRAFASG